MSYDDEEQGAGFGEIDETEPIHFDDDPDMAGEGEGAEDFGLDEEDPDRDS